MEKNSPSVRRYSHFVSKLKHYFWYLHQKRCSHLPNTQETGENLTVVIVQWSGIVAQISKVGLEIFVKCENRLRYELLICKQKSAIEQGKILRCDPIFYKYPQLYEPFQFIAEEAHVFSIF